jgi:hypothetical protein
VAMGHDPQQKHAQIRDLSKLLQTREETHSGNNNKSINDVMDAIDGGVQVVHSDLKKRGTGFCIDSASGDALDFIQCFGTDVDATRRDGTTNRSSICLDLLG